MKVARFVRSGCKAGKEGPILGCWRGPSAEQAGGDNDSVEGTDITIPVYNFKETHYNPIALVTPAYKAALFYLTGKVNALSFNGFAAGEVLFRSVSRALTAI